jgi:hypothetical protein
MGDTIHPQQKKNLGLKNTKQNLTKIVQKKNLHNTKKNETLKFMCSGILNHYK